MSWLAGIVALRGGPAAVEDPTPLAAALARRGPDGHALRPPAGDADAQAAWTAVDGRLHGSAPTDVDAVAARWETQGAAVLDRLAGEWALARWEPGARRLWLARDPFGTRPLYFARHGDRVAFASTIPALLALPWVSDAPALDRIAEYLSFRYVHAPGTLLRDVQAVPAGHLVRVDPGGVRIERWWDPGWARPDTTVPDDEQAATAVDDALRRAIQRRLPADEDAAVLLSGGLDSSAILFHAHALRPDISACTVALADDPAEESPFAARVATVLGARHEVIRIGTADLVAAVDEAAAAMGQPMPSPAAVIQLLFFRHLAAHRRVLLGGDGGDEVLGGRGIEHIAARMRSSRGVGLLPRPARGLVRRAAKRAGLRDLAVPPDHFGADRLIGGSRVFKSHERVEVLRDIGLIRPGIRRTVLEPLYQEVDTDPLNQVLHVWQRGWLPEDSLARAERMAAAAGVEIRYPVLDRELVALANGWPSPAKVQRHGLRYTTKVPLRRAMAGRLPDRLLDRPKRSLPQPLDNWLRTGGAAFLRDRTQAIIDAPGALWSAEGVGRLVSDHLEGRGNHGLKLWTLILYQAWRDSLGS